MSRRRWKAYGEDWPEGHRLCLKCKEMKLLTEFHKHSGCLRGYNTVCKVCRKPTSKAQYRKTDLINLMLHRCKSRAIQKKLDFNLSKRDIKIPEICPVLGIQLKAGTLYTPSVDRIDPTKGYVKDNIQIISNRANLLKNNGTIEEFEKLLIFLKKKSCL